MPEAQTDTAPISAAPLTLSRIIGTPDDAAISRINALAPVAQDADAVFVFNGTVSTNALDSYGTIMDPATTLRNFASELGQGRALMNSHRTGWIAPLEFAIGRSFAGELTTPGDAEGSEATAAVLGSYYIQRGLQVTDVHTDHIIRAIEGGTVHRMSVGFMEGPDTELRCNTCGVDQLTDWEWRCSHFPGIRAQDGTINRATYINAHLGESSLVYLNSTPGALIARAQAMAADGAMSAHMAERVESKYGIRGLVPNGTTSYPSHRSNDVNELQDLMQRLQSRIGAQLSAKNKERLNGWQTSAQGISEGIAELLESVAAESEADRAALSEVRTVLGDDLTGARLATLNTEAEMGRKYRDSLIDECVKARVGARGADFNADRYKSRLARFDVDELEEEFEELVGQKYQRFQAGRRVPAQVVPAGNGHSDDSFLPE